METRHLTHAIDFGAKVLVFLVWFKNRDWSVDTYSPPPPRAAKVKKVIANDYSADAFTAIKRNAEYNGAQPRAEPFHLYHHF